MGGCTVFHGGCAVFWGRCTVFQGRCTVFCCRTALTYKLCILLLLDYFHPRNHGFVSCLPFTEHVQTLFTLNWACANSVLGMCRNNLHNLPCFWQFWLITMTETEHEHRLRLIDLTTSKIAICWDDVVWILCHVSKCQNNTQRKWPKWSIISNYYIWKK